MKKPLIFIIAITSVAAFSACSGDHTTTQGKDSAQYQYSTNPYMDTFKTTTTMGDASNLDNGGSGGTMIEKAKMQLINPPTQVSQPAKPIDTAIAQKK